MFIVGDKIVWKVFSDVLEICSVKKLKYMGFITQNCCQVAIQSVLGK